MISEVFDFFPFNMASGPAFLVFYFFFTLFAMIGLGLLRRAVGARLDRGFRPPPAPIPVDDTAAANPYRAQGAAPATARERLTVGWIPLQDELWAIAYLEGHQRGVANTLISTAMSSGWLVCLNGKPDTVLFRPKAPSEDQALSTFFAKLARYERPELTIAEVRDAANLAAYELTAEIKRDLAATGMDRPTATVNRLKVITGIGGALILGVGVIRLLRAMELDRPASLLVWEMIFILAAVALMTVATSTESTLRAEYLRWLADATVSLRADLASGKSHEPVNVGLAVAVGGVSALAAAAPLAMIYAALEPDPVMSASSDGTSSISSSGGSSCSSGGGSSCSSGGSSCGGGGSSCGG